MEPSSTRASRRRFELRAGDGLDLVFGNDATNGRKEFSKFNERRCSLGSGSGKYCDNLGVRFDRQTGFCGHSALAPTIDLVTSTRTIVTKPFLRRILVSALLSALEPIDAKRITRSFYPGRKDSPVGPLDLVWFTLLLSK